MQSQRSGASLLTEGPKYGACQVSPFKCSKSKNLNRIIPQSPFHAPPRQSELNLAENWETREGVRRSHTELITVSDAWNINGAPIWHLHAPHLSPFLDIISTKCASPAWRKGSTRPLFLYLRLILNINKRQFKWRGWEGGEWCILHLCSWVLHLLNRRDFKQLKSVIVYIEDTIYFLIWMTGDLAKGQRHDIATKFVKWCGTSSFMRWSVKRFGALTPVRIFQTKSNPLPKLRHVTSMLHLL